MDGIVFDANLVIYLLGLAATWGAVMVRIKSLEDKVDKHNNMVERMYHVEEQAQRCEGRIKELEALHPRKDD